MKRILIFNVNWRGDVLFSTPFIRAVKRKFPGSFLAVLVVPRCAQILANNPHLDELLIFDEAGKHKGLWGKLKLIGFLRSKHFDTVFLLHRSLTRTLICWLAGIGQRVGYFRPKRAVFLTKRIPNPDRPLHKVEYFLNIARACGIESKNKSYEFFLSREEKNYAKDLLQKNGIGKDNFLVVINPGGNWPLKRWPKENFARLADRLVRDYRARIIITGAEKDLPLASDIASLMQGCPLILCGKTTLGQLAAVMARASLVIANDSGPMHIAVSQRAKTIALFGPTCEKITGPYGKGTYRVLHKDIGCPVPCYQLDCKDNRCMKVITVEDVLGAIDV